MGGKHAPPPGHVSPVIGSNPIKYKSFLSEYSDNVNDGNQITSIRSIVISYSHLMSESIKSETVFFFKSKVYDLCMSFIVLLSVICSLCKK